jgi:polysaccharide export outer membrane protein
MRALKNFLSYLTAILLIAGIVGSIPSNTEAQSAGKSSSTQATNSDSSKGTNADSVAQTGPGYVIGAGDVLSINVWRETEISQKLVVRPDGMITLPLVGDITAMGQTPEQLAEIVSKKLESVLTSPQVSVIVAEVHSKFYVVVGEVAKPGQYPLTRPTTVIEAISQAGGFRDFAKTSKMYILRLENGKRVRIPFNYTKVVKGKDPGQEVDLNTGDEIVVP